MAAKCKIVMLLCNTSWVQGLCIDQSENCRFLEIVNIWILQKSESPDFKLPDF